MLQKFKNYLTSGSNLINTFSGKINLRTTKISDRKLAEDLEATCAKQDGILTYSEYLNIVQYGNNGYSAVSHKDGRTDANKRWGKALAAYCLKNNYSSVVEFGCGSGELGLTAAGEYKKSTGKILSWTGIEINRRHYEAIENNFKKSGLEDSLNLIVPSVDKINHYVKSVFVFSYSLDSIPPEIFLNTSTNTTYPDSVIGLKIENGVLHEELIPAEIQNKKGIFFQNGLFRSQNSQTFDLRSWNLRRGQRAYIPVNSYKVILQFIKRIANGSAIIVIDEFRNSPFRYEASPLGLPKSMYEKDHDCIDITKYYKESGRHYLYFPNYFETFYKFLHFAGFKNIKFDIEQKSAAQLCGKKWIQLRRQYNTYAFIAGQYVPKSYDVCPIVFFPRKIF